MAEFCITCTDRGNCIGEIEGIRIRSSQTMGRVEDRGNRRSVAILSIEEGVPIGPTFMQIVYNDLNDGRSEPINHSGPSYDAAVDSARRYDKKVEACEGPVVKRKFLGLLKTIKCGAE